MRFAVLSLLCLTWLHHSIVADDGVIFDKNSRCGATFPAKPKYMKDNGNDIWVLTQNKDTQTFVASFGKLTDKLDVKNADEVKKRFDQVLQNLKTNLGSAPTKVTEETFGKEKWPARYVEFKMDATTFFHSRIVIAPDRMATVAVSGPKTWLGGKEVEAYFKSLKMDE